MDSGFSGFEGFQWDAGNSHKNLIKHNVQNWECEQAFFNRPLMVLFDSLHSAVEECWAAFGKADSNRLLVIIFTKRDSLLRVISARDMDTKERKYYEEYKNKNSPLRE
jgi:uncharacterized DUF497 family protein